MKTIMILCEYWSADQLTMYSIHIIIFFDFCIMVTNGDDVILNCDIISLENYFGKCHRHTW